MNIRFQGIVSAVLAFTLWSTLGLFFAAAPLPTAMYVTNGSLVALAILLFIFYLQKQLSGLERIPLNWPTVTLFLMAAIKGVIWFAALRVYPIAAAMLIHNLAPLFAGLFSWIILKERPGKSQILAMITGFLGLALILEFNSTAQFISLGALLSLGAAICSGLQDIAQRKLASNKVTAPHQALIFILGQAVGSMIFLSPNISTTFDWNAVLPIVYFGIFGTALPIILLSRAFTGLKAFEVATLGYIEPLLGAILGGIFLHQPIYPTTALAGALIFLSGITAVRTEKH